MKDGPLLPGETGPLSFVRPSAFTGLLRFSVADIHFVFRQFNFKNPKKNFKLVYEGKDL